VSKNYAASPSTSRDRWTVTLHDADGVGVRLFSLDGAEGVSNHFTDTVIRVLLAALKLDGGLERALEVLKAEHIRQENSP
jgi:hypothetical protein